MGAFMRHILSIAIAAIVISGIATAPRAQPAPIKPYKPVALKLAPPLADPGFKAFRKQLAAVARTKDRAELGKLVVTDGFFWQTKDGEKADKAKSSVDNLSVAIGLSDASASGWDHLIDYAGIAAAGLLPLKDGVVCAPVDPAFDDNALMELARVTQTDPGDWAYPLTKDVEARASNAPHARVTEKLGLYFVRILPDENSNQAALLRVVMPSGKIGYVSVDAIMPLGNDQLCYVKEDGAWKITGYVGSGQQ